MDGETDWRLAYKGLEARYREVRDAQALLEELVSEGDSGALTKALLDRCTELELLLDRNGIAHS